MDLDLKNEDDRALLAALPNIAAAMFSHVAHDPQQIVVLFSLRRHEPGVRVLSTPIQPPDPELASVLEGAPTMPNVRVVSLHRDGRVTWRDANAGDLIDAEETAPA